MAHGMKRLLTASVLIFACGCGGGGSTQAPAVGVVCPAMAAMGSLVYPASGAVGVLDSQSVVVVAGGLSVETLQLQPQSGQDISSTTMVPVPPLPMSSTPIRYSPVLAFQIPKLAVATMYRVTGLGPSPCYVPTEFGSFTTK
jgi:hypothetical protein